MHFDLAITETLNGGDLVKNGNDLLVVYNNQNQPYIAWFGGNVEANTANPPPVERNDFWGNDLFLLNSPELQYNSFTERTLDNSVLNSAGRLIIEGALKTDLNYLKSAGYIISITTEIVSTNRIDVLLNCVFPNGDSKVILISLEKSGEGDFAIADFNDDFFI